MRTRNCTRARLPRDAKMAYDTEILYQVSLSLFLLYEFVCLLCGYSTATLSKKLPEKQIRLSFYFA